MAKWKARNVKLGISISSMVQNQYVVPYYVPPPFFIFISVDGKFWFIIIYIALNSNTSENLLLKSEDNCMILHQSISCCHLLMTSNKVFAHYFCCCLCMPKNTISYCTVALLCLQGLYCTYFLKVCKLCFRYNVPLLLGATTSSY